MKQYLKSYQVVMRTEGPVFVGSGREIGKREYIWMSEDRVGITDIQKLYAEMKKRQKRAEFENYLLGSSGLDLTKWLRSQKIRVEEMRPYIRYMIDCKNVPREKRGNRLTLQECIKDPYGNPYIPGSTLKGMFRTILLGADILEHKDREKYQDAKSRMSRNANAERAGKQYLKGDIDRIEAIRYRTLKKDEKNPVSAVNDVLQGLIVSDSDPLPVNCLTLCQKVDLHVKGKIREIPILRECIKPGTDIRFTVTVDANVCDVTQESLMKAVETFITYYYARFAKSFKGAEKPKRNYVLCGGGCGFASKTIIYSMYGKQDGIDITQKIFAKTGVPGKHKHDMDKDFGASPHMMKCTRWQGNLCQMGLCSIKMTEITEM